MAFRKLFGIALLSALFSNEFSVQEYNYRVGYRYPKKTEETAYFEVLDDKVTLEKFEDFKLVSLDSLFIQNDDTLRLCKGCSDILKIVKKEFAAIDNNLERRINNYTIITKSGKLEVVANYKNNILELYPKKGHEKDFLIKELGIKNITFYVRGCTETNYIPIGMDIRRTGKVTSLAYYGYRPLKSKL